MGGIPTEDLAERLSISDKTVSRWEQDEGTPDLAMVPVIAEIFGVTCDDLLRGERKSPADRMGHRKISEIELQKKSSQKAWKILKKPDFGIKH